MRSPFAAPSALPSQSSRRLLRDSLSACLADRPDITVVGRAAEPDSVLSLCELRQPDVVILDAGPRLAEIAVLVSDLTRRFPEVNVIVSYRDATEQGLAAVCRAGVSSLVPESHGLAALLSLLRPRKGRHARKTPGSLTDREIEIVVLTASGHSVGEMAALLGISPLTVENLKRSVFAKLDVNSSAHAVSKAASLGMLDRTASPAAPRTRAETAEFSRSWPCVRPGGSRQRSDSSGTDRDPAGVRSDSDAGTGCRNGLGPVASWPDRGHPGRSGRQDWELVSELGIPAILVHSKPVDPPELSEALACGASALIPADRIADHFLSVLLMVSQGYLVVGSRPMRSLIGARGPAGKTESPGRVALPELTARESDILRCLAQGHSIRQAARALGIAPKTVENVQTRLFRKLGVRTGQGRSPSPMPSACCLALPPPARRSSGPWVPQGIFVVS